MYKLYLGGAVVGIALLISYFVYQDSTSLSEVADSSIAANTNGTRPSDAGLADRLLAKLDENAERTNQNIDSLAQELDSLSGRLSELEAANGIEPSVAEYDTPEVLVERDIELLEQQRLDKLNQKFLDEPYDEASNEQAKIGVDNIFLNPDNTIYQEVQLLSSACRGATCKLEVAINNGVDSAVFEDSLLSDTAKLGFNYMKSHVKVIGGVVTTTYFTSEVEPPPPGANPAQRLVR